MSRYFNQNKKIEGDSPLITSTSKQIRRKRHRQEQLESKKIETLLNTAELSKVSTNIFEEGREKFLQKYETKIALDEEKVKTYSRGDGLPKKGLKNKILEKKIKNKDIKFGLAAKQSARSELLLTEQSGYLEAEEGERTTWLKQSQLAKAVDITSATKYFNLHLDFGTYRANYTRNGRHLLLGGRKGHVAAFDWITKKLHCEINVMEEVFDVKWLHIETMYAVAQKKWVYIYDNTGTEIHCLKRLNNVLRMEFLPYHFLLVTASEEGYLTWLDVSTGTFVSQCNSRMGRLSVMTQNPYNAIICTGHSKGTVNMWSPNVREPVAKMLCHKTALSSVAVDPKGLYMATAAVDKNMNIWDIRNLDGPLQKYTVHSVPSNLSFSQKGFLALALGNAVEVYDDCCRQTAKHPYLRHRLYSDVGNIQFCPYEDVLGIGHYTGFTSMLVPGSGEPNIDALECNPFQTKKQRQEAEVKSLLEKIQPELISLDPFDIIQVDVPTLKEKVEARNALMNLKPTKIDFTPRSKKKKGLSQAKVKKIVREQKKKDFVRVARSIKEKLQNEVTATGVEESIPKEYKVLDRFKPKMKRK